MPPMDVAVIDGKQRGVYWLPALYPDKGAGGSTKCQFDSEAKIYSNSALWQNETCDK